jgi:hypothetical protein
LEHADAVGERVRGERAVVDHYDVASPDDTSVGAGPAAECLRSVWTDAVKRSEKIVDRPTR